MIIEIDPRLSEVRPLLLDADNFRALKLVLKADVADDDMAAVLAVAAGKLGTLAGSYLFMQPQSIQALAGDRAGDSEWKRQFDGMIAYAAASGWVNASGAVRLHVEYVRA